MTSAVADFKAIALKLNRLEQKAEWDAKNPKPEPTSQFTWQSEWGYGNLPPGNPWGVKI